MSTPSPTSDAAVNALAAATAGGDGTAARRLLASLPDDVRREVALGQLAGAAAAASPLAVELLVEQLDELKVVRDAVRRFLLDEAAIDDVTQDTLIAVAQSIGSFKGHAKFTTWLHQIARNRAVDHLRRRRATVALPEDGQTPADRISSLLASREKVRELLSGLPVHYREALVLRDVERLTYEETATQLGRNVNTVKSHVARGRALLAATLTEQDQFDTEHNDG